MLEETLPGVGIAVNAARPFQTEALHDFLCMLLGLPMDNFGHAQAQPSPLVPFQQPSPMVPFQQTFTIVLTDSSLRVEFWHSLITREIKKARGSCHP